jgi:hypothetical protein
MKEEDIKTLFGKAWDEMYPTRTPWEKLNEETKAEWVKIVLLYEKYKAS